MVYVWDRLSQGEALSCVAEWLYIAGVLTHKLWYLPPGITLLAFLPNHKHSYAEVEKLDKSILNMYKVEEKLEATT